ncbi:hypothetical protein KR009_007891 [Drosophila setifemur]|nr:hypothetical protein KR009_007891 [Drosophila setifemur]
MADGFKKYFNGTTLSGRANVAKATYATLALLYIFYRMKKGAKPSPQLTSGKCSCEGDQDVGTDTGLYDVDPDCSVCRERSERAMTEYDREQQRKAASEDDDGCRDDPPPPPPASPARRKCPCEESTSLKHSSNSKVKGHKFQSPYQYQQHLPHTPPEQEEDHLTSQLADQVSGVYRVIRSYVGTLLGGSTAHIAAVGEESSTAGAVKEEEREYETGEEVPLKRRTAPRSCVPTSDGGQQEEEEEQGESDPRSGSQPQADYSGFSDGFASGLFFAAED